MYVFFCITKIQKQNHQTEGCGVRRKIYMNCKMNHIQNVQYWWKQDPVGCRIGRWVIFNPPLLSFECILFFYLRKQFCACVFIYSYVFVCVHIHMPAQSIGAVVYAEPLPFECPGCGTKPSYCETRVLELWKMLSILSLSLLLVNSDSKW